MYVLERIGCSGEYVAQDEAGCTYTAYLPHIKLFDTLGEARAEQFCNEVIRAIGTMTPIPSEEGMLPRDLARFRGVR